MVMIRRTVGTPTSTISLPRPGNLRNNYYFVIPFNLKRRENRSLLTDECSPIHISKCPHNGQAQPIRERQARGQRTT